MTGSDKTPGLHVVIFNKLVSRHPDIITDTPPRMAQNNHPPSDSATTRPRRQRIAIRMYVPSTHVHEAQWRGD